MIKVVGGIAGGRILKVPRGKEVRPTSNRVREALFNILEEKTVKAEVLDLYCGSGALGIEALSRGAADCVFVDKNRGCILTVRQNIKKLRLPGKVKFFNLEVTAAIRLLDKEKKRFNLIFLDPPYYRNLGTKTLRSLSHRDILKPIGLVVVEHYQKDLLPPVINSLILFRRVQYGETVLSFFKKDRKNEKESGLSGQF